MDSLPILKKNETEERLKRFCGISISLHALFILFLILSHWVFPSNALLIQPTIQIDLVALPDVTKSPEQQIDTTLPVKENLAPPKATPAEPEEKDVLTLPKEKTKNPEKAAKSALERLKAEMAKENKNKNKNLLNEKEQELKHFEEKYRATLKGNQLHAGSSTSGSMEETLNAYGASITERLRNNWSLPAWLQSGNFRAVVRIYIDSNGNIYRYYFTRTSGDQVFDDSVKRTLQHSTPLPPPPADMASRLRSGGLEVTFPL